MICLRCGSVDEIFSKISSYVRVKSEQKMRVKRGGGIGWILAAICTCGLPLLMPRRRRTTIIRETVRKMKCHDCGYRWKA